MKTFGALGWHKKQQRRARTAEQLESYTRQEWNNIPPQRSKAPQFPGVYRLPLKEDRTLHSGKHGPVPTFFKRVTAIKFQISCKMSHFQHLKCFLCSNVSKITCHCTLFFFTFYSVPTFLGNWGCIFYFFWLAKVCYIFKYSFVSLQSVQSLK